VRVFGLPFFSLEFSTGQSLMFEKRLNFSYVCGDYVCLQFERLVGNVSKAFERHGKVWKIGMRIMKL
jgi:hypothetical protein